MNDKSIHMSMIAFMDDDAINTNDKYLYEFCKIALYQEGYAGLCLTDLRERILEFVPLDYTEEEISRCIKTMKGKEIVFEKEKYFLTSKADTEMQGREKTFALRKHVDNYCDLFLRDNQVHDRNSLCDLVSKFLFEKFQESMDQIYCILDPSNRTGLQYSNDYTDEEKEFINGFLVWDNEEKNQTVYKLVIKSYDFCAINCSAQMTFDFSEFDFYLDANIVMRLMGINNVRRKDVVERFINKCKQANINLHVSAFSKVEIQRSIDKQINGIKTFIEETGRVVSPEIASFVPTDRFSHDMYKKFYNYIQKERTINLNGFKQHMYHELEICLEKFAFEDAVSYEIENNTDFQKYIAALSKIKDGKVVKTDANNILLVLDRRETNKDTYMISADGRLINWCKDVFVGKTSLVEFPSVWLALVMKYTGRATQDDYSAFCKFIRLPIVTKDKDIKEKTELKALIDKMDTSDYMKDRMMEELQNNFEHYSELETVDEMQQEAYRKLMDEHDEKIRAEERKKSDDKIKHLCDEHEQEKQEILENMEEVKQRYQEVKRENDDNSIEKRIANVVKDKVDKKMDCSMWIENHRMRLLLFLFFFMLLVMAGIFFLIRNAVTISEGLLGFFLALATFILEYGAKYVLGSLIEKWGNEEEMKSHYEKKYKKKYKEIIT